MTLNWKALCDQIQHFFVHAPITFYETLCPLSQNDVKTILLTTWYFFFHYRRSEYEEVRFIVALLLLRLLSSFFFPNIAVFTLVSKTHWFCITMQYTIGFKKSRHFRSYSFSRALPHVFTSSFDWLIELFCFGFTTLILLRFFACIFWDFLWEMSKHTQT